MSTTVSTKPVRLVGLVAIIAGVALIVAGAATWFMVRGQLIDENITVAEDAAMFGGERVDGPLDAYFQADIINHHALDASGGKTYAELDKEDPVRATMMNASFLRSSLFTSVIAFGVAAFAAGMGLLFLLVGWALRLVAPVGTVITGAKDAASLQNA
ncbi:aromatic ring-opening dioxygenase LigA [Actinotalea ferrariae]|uniref:aromatic ring-opening dioxygenase LigA n=1 Tax=Actinotalea ferrariae TaxID=1386098 RepID=UPI001C8C034E|nr:aromatic ring-opening dioxygenase LigA [Actinotalea ferrariae]MBX9244914.1 aromatic ring-opening dioxygenase LigA [Actinotalea ferrariae]